MSFEYAPVSKGLMLGSAITSIVFGLFDLKHYLHLQLVPHISRYHQYWRLPLHHVAFGSSSDLFLAEILLYNVGVHVERHFGSVKFASFVAVSTIFSTLLEFAALILFNRVGLNYIPAGPIALVFAIIYQYFRIIPSSYQFRIFRVPVSNKIFTYIVASQLGLSHIPGSIAVALIGILTGQVYRSDLANLKGYRLPPSFVRFSTKYLLPLIGSTRPPRRLTRALPDLPRTATATSSPTDAAASGARQGNEEVITTRRTEPVSAESNQDRANDTARGNVSSTSVMREWVNELTGRAERANAGIRAVPEAEVSQLTNMFPDVTRDVVVLALQRSPNIESAVETLLNTAAA